MKINKLTALLAVAGGIATAAQMAGTPASAMTAYQWKNRPLLVFAPANGGPSLSRQLGIVRANAGGFRGRDMVVVVIKGDSVSMALGRGQSLGADALRRRYGVPKNTFRAILVGKDGGAKISSGAPLGAEQLFGTIDAMPMRRDEMRRRGQ